MNLQEMSRADLETAYLDALKVTMRLHQNEAELSARCVAALESAREAQKLGRIAERIAAHALDAARRAETELMLAGVAFNLMTGRKL